MILKTINLLKRSASPVAGNSTGSILVLALWSLCLLTSFAIILNSVVRQKLLVVERIDERSRMHFIAEAGVKKAIAQIQAEDPGKTYMALKDDWSNNPGAFQNRDVGYGSFNICYNYRNDQTGTVENLCGLVDEERKSNLNKAAMPAIERLLRIVLNLNEMEAQELAASIVDWRDADSELSIPMGSAETSQYRDLIYPYEAKNGDIEVLDELLLVKGMKTDYLERLKDYATIYGDGRVNINTASREVLSTLGLSEENINRIMTYRQGEDKVIGTEDDNVFAGPQEVAPKLSQSGTLSDSDVAQITNVADLYLSANSNNFTVRSIATLNHKDRIFGITAIINRKGKILYWQES
jgi:type II secretory pathway component PulK